MSAASTVHVFYESGLAVNVLYGVEPASERAVGFQAFSESMEVPAELSAIKFAEAEVQARRRDPRVPLRHQASTRVSPQHSHGAVPLEALT